MISDLNECSNRVCGFKVTAMFGTQNKRGYQYIFLTPLPNPMLWCSSEYYKICFRGDVNTFWLKTGALSVWSYGFLVDIDKFHLDE